MIEIATETEARTVFIFFRGTAVMSHLKFSMRVDEGSKMRGARFSTQTFGTEEVEIVTGIEVRMQQERP